LLVQRVSRNPVTDVSRYLRDVAINVPRLRHLLWGGYVREASEAVKQMLAQLDQHPGFRDALGKIRRLYELISNLRTYLLQNEAFIVNYCRRYWSGLPILTGRLAAGGRC